MFYKFSDLCEKEVINCTDGAVIGNISDIEISAEDCKVIAIYIRCGKNIFSKHEEIKIPWDKIEKIGIDVIIVNHCSIRPQRWCNEKQNKRSLFNRSQC